jgi:hypothetical protein
MLERFAYRCADWSSAHLVLRDKSDKLRSRYERSVGQQRTGEPTAY